MTACPRVHADHTQIQQIILNLLKNAIDAMSSSPQKRLRVATALYEDSTVVFSVQDSGAGISGENQERIFDAFFTTKPEGMGLGLAICRTIVENYRHFTDRQIRLGRHDIRGRDAS